MLDGRMIKSLIILALLLALLGGAALSRPSEASFKELTARKMQAESGGGFLDKLLLQTKIDNYLSDCTYTNRVLWADVEKDGVVIYSGAFSKWFDRTDAKVSKPEG
jgi:hypothetical protein